jgi:hypothetical protein
VGFDDVLRLCRDLPGIEVGTSFGTPALRVRRKFMCRMREGNETLVLTPIDEIQQRFLREMRKNRMSSGGHILAQRAGWRLASARKSRGFPGR